MNKVIKIIGLIIIFLCGFIVGFSKGSPSDLDRANFETLPYKVELIIAYENYQCDVENLLDTIATHNPSFMDTIAEMDIYNSYCNSRAKVDSLLECEE